MNSVYSAKNNKNDLTPDPYTHWTIKEIYEQMDSSLRSMSLGGRLLSNNEVKLGGLEGHEENLCKLENIILLGCGTSYNAGLLGEQIEFKPTVELWSGNRPKWMHKAPSIIESFSDNGTLERLQELLENLDQRN